ncbi:MAG TPA: hypothetical protein DEV87_01460 [Clostridiales bacterium]|nr:hypothetical protein [Clostridiales bacterium]
MSEISKKAFPAEKMIEEVGLIDHLNNFPIAVTTDSNFFVLRSLVAAISAKLCTATVRIRTICAMRFWAAS